MSTSAAAATAVSGPCPCHLTQEQLEKFGLVGEHGVCTAYKKGSNKTVVCGELFVDHPRAGSEGFSSWFSRWRNYLFGTEQVIVSAQPDLGIEVEKVLDCTVVIKSANGARGNGIIVHPDKLLTSLHGYFKKNDPFEVVDRHGISRRGFVLHAWYAENEVDIAVIQLNADSQKFVSFVPVSPNAVKLGDELYVISRRAVGYSDHFTNCLEKSVVTAVVDDTCIFHSTYYAEVGMPGCGVVATLRGHSFKVVGVHCASHDRTTAVEVKKAVDQPRGKKKRKMNSGESTPVSREEFGDAMMTVNSNIHGHGAYNLICEVARVEGLLALLT